MLKSTKYSVEGEKDIQGKFIERPISTLVAESVWTFLKKVTSGISTDYKEYFDSSIFNQIINMARRARGCEEMGAVYLLRSVKDQVSLLQEKRGYTPEENNFVNLCSIIVQQTGSALYTLFTMFLAILPAATILLHVSHFLLDRILDIATTRRQSDLLYKGVIFILQVVAILWVLHFLIMSIFAPIFNLQVAVISKLNFFTPRTSTPEASLLG